MTTGYGMDSPLDELNALLESLALMTDQIDKELQDLDEDGPEDWQDEWAASARRGEYGDDWQIVQRRIDREETTLDDVLTGGDNSREAQNIRNTSRERMEELTEQWQDDEDIQAGQDELTEMAHDLQVRIENLTQQLKGL